MAKKYSESRADALIKKANAVVTQDMAGIRQDSWADPENYVSYELGGLMNPDQFRVFHEWVQDGTVLLQMIRNETLNAPIREIDKMGIGRRVLEGVEETQAVTKLVRPDFGKVLLTTTKLMAQLNYSYETVEDNIERGGWQTRVMRQLAERVAVDLEELILLGDRNIVDPNELFLNTQDGLIKRMVTQRAAAPWVDGAPRYGGHLIDKGGAPIDQSAWVDLLDNVPGKYWRDRGDYIFLTSPHLELAWREELINRQTALGDYFVLTNNKMVSMGIPVVTSPHIPEGYTINPGARLSMQYSSPGWHLTPPTPGSTPGIPSDDRVLTPYLGPTGTPTPADSRATMLFLINPKNIIMGTWRNITIETDKDIERQVYKVVLSMRVGVVLEEPDALGVAYNITRKALQP